MLIIPYHALSALPKAVVRLESVSMLEDVLNFSYQSNLVKSRQTFHAQETSDWVLAATGFKRWGQKTSYGGV